MVGLASRATVRWHARSTNLAGMPTEQVNGLIQTIGVIAQFFGALLLVGLFALLRTRALRRDYFNAWARAWLSLVVAIGAMASRRLLLASYDARLLNSDFQNLRFVYVVYQFAKLMFFAFLVLGTVAYLRGAKSRTLLLAAVIAAAAYTATSVAFSSALATVIVWQVPVAVCAFSYCAYLLVSVPRSRRSLGNRATAAAFALMAALWALYAVAFGYTSAGEGGAAYEMLALVVRYNGYADLLLQMLLGYGMVVILMEDAKREVDDAHAELAVAHDQLLRVSLYDSLTGSLNRRAFSEGVGLEAAKHTFGCVVVVDTDNLKQVNDGYGHGVGDVLLQHIAVTLRTALPLSGRLYRWGGDEFLLVLPGLRAAEGQARLDAALAAAAPVPLGRGGEPIAILVSVGVADYASGEALDGAIERADGRMYADKERRRAERRARGAAASAAGGGGATPPAATAAG